MFVCSIELGTSELTNKKQLLLLHFSMRSSCVWAICVQIRMYSRIRIALFDVRKEQRQKKWKSSCLHATAARLTIMILSFPCSFGERHWLLSIRYTIYIFMAFYLLALFFSYIFLWSVVNFWPLFKADHSVLYLISRENWNAVVSVRTSFQAFLVEKWTGVFYLKHLFTLFSLSYASFTIYSIWFAVKDEIKHKSWGREGKTERDRKINFIVLFNCPQNRNRLE